MGDAIPGRTKILASSVVFVFASVFLLFEFTSIHYGWPAAQDDLTTWNILGVLEGVGWVIGFVLLIDWIVFEVQAPIMNVDERSFDRQGLIGATLKLIASVLFCIQPISYLAGYLPDSYGCPWSNFAGICFFHTGNMINAIGMLPLIDCAAPALANAPPIGMIVFASATWFLVVADGIFYFSLPVPNGPGYHVGGMRDFVAPGQVIGASLLLVGSLMYTMWAAIFGKSSTVRASDPLLRAVQPQLDTGLPR